MKTNEMPPSDDVLPLLLKRTRRGMILFPALCIAAIVAGGFYITARHNMPWLITAWLLATCLLLAYRHVRARHDLAQQVANDPNLVYWAHSSNRLGPCMDVDISNSTLIILHLRNGAQLEVELPLDEMNTLMAWLREHNPSIRWGRYDSVMTTDDGPQP